MGLYRRARRWDPAPAAAYARRTRGGSNLRRALFGGTFDPPHVGHLAVAQAAWEQLDVDVVTFLPAGDPWQKSDDRPITPVGHRCRMLSAAIEDVEYFEVDTREVDRDGPTYTWDTVESFGFDGVVLVLGADAAAGVRSWYRGEELVEQVPIAVARRPGTSTDAVETAIPAVQWLEMPSLEISSTELRAWLAGGFTARFLVPDPVLEIISAESLYRS